MNTVKKRQISKKCSQRTAGGVVVGPDGRIAVVNQWHNSWSLPKGHVDSGENDLTAATREIHEETGLTELKLVKRLGEYERPSISKDGCGEQAMMKTRVIFLFTTPQTILKPLDLENPEAIWVKKEDVANWLTHPKDKEFFRSVISKIS